MGWKMTIQLHAIKWYVKDKYISLHEVLYISIVDPIGNHVQL
jgi:hypothetical protein